VALNQDGYDLRCEFGLAGLQALVPGSDVIVIVDVLSFSTAVDIAVSRGASVLPYRWRDPSAAQFASKMGALLASARNESGDFSLSPASLQSIPAGSSLVLPSPNGSTLCLSTNGVPTYTACLRNAPAVARRAVEHGPRISIIPAGEQWGDGSLRPCLEDLAGAGALLAEMAGARSPEADAAVAVFERFRANFREALMLCSSGQELAARGFACDLELAAAYNASTAAPLLAGGRFVNDPPGMPHLD
jgi:2-phosphosulfolactate phosphatase